MKKLRYAGLSLAVALAVVGCNAGFGTKDSNSQNAPEQKVSASKVTPLAWDKTQPFASFNASQAEQQQQVNYVLQNAQRLELEKLYIAANTAFKLERLEDAGLLFYAAILRTESDIDKYPPAGNGEASPVPYLNFLAVNSAARIDQALSFNPDQYDAVLKRFSAWNCQAPSDYKPSWEYSAVNPNAESCEVIKRKRVVPMQRLAKLFTNPEYRANVEKLRDYLMLDQQQQMQEQAIATRNQRLQSMLDYEKQQNTPGIAAALLRSQQQDGQETKQ